MRYELIEDYDWWGVIDTKEEFEPEEDWMNALSNNQVITIMNSQDKKITELKTENDILRNVMSTDLNRMANSMLELHRNMREEREYYDRVQFERNTLKKWYAHLKGRTPAFNARELAYLKSLREE